MRKVLVTLLTLFVLLLIPSGMKADVINGNISVSSEPCTTNGYATLLSNQKALQYLQLNKDYVLTIQKDTTLNDDGNLAYPYVGGSYTFTTTNEDNFYEVYVSNPENVSGITFTLYDKDKVKCEYTRAEQVVEQGRSLSAIYKLRPNTRYFVSLGVANTEDLATSQVISRVKPIKDDCPDNTVNALSIQANRGYEYQLNGYNDVDYFTFTPNSDKAFYTITYGGMDLQSSKLEFFTQSLEKVCTLDLRANEEMSQAVDLKANTRYYIKVYSENEFAVGRYYFSLTKTMDDVKDNPSVATKLSANKSYSYGIQSTFDRDVFSFNTGKYGAYNFEVINNDSNTSNSIEVTIQDQNGMQVGSTTINGWARNYIELTGINKNMTYYIFVSGTQTSGSTYNIKITNIKRTITYHLNKGKNNSKNKKYYYICGTTKLYNPVRENYKFLGWYTAEDYNDYSKKTGFTDTDQDDIELWAKWEKVDIQPVKTVKAKAKSKKKVQVTFNKVKGKIGGYEINWSTKKSFPESTTKSKKVKTSKYNISGLKKSTKYYIRVRPYIKSGSQYIYGSGKTVSVKTKK